MTSYNNYSNRHQQKTIEKSTKFSKTGVDLSKSLNTHHGLEFVEKGYEPPDTLSESLKQKIEDLFADTAISNAECIVTNNKSTTSPLRKKNTFDFGGVYMGPTESNSSSKRKSFQDRRGSASLNDLQDNFTSQRPFSAIKPTSNPLAVPQIHLEPADAEDFHFPKEADGGTPSKRRSKIEYVRGTSAPELKGGGSSSTSICNLFEDIPQREFFEAGYDPCAAINQSGKEASSKEAFSHGKRPSSSSSSSPVLQQPFLTSKAKATSFLRLPNSSNFSTTLVIDEFKIQCKLIVIQNRIKT